MHVANLQIQGLLMAVASINAALRQKGLLCADDIDLALRKAEASMTSEDRINLDMTPANRDAFCFPVRFLRLANSSAAEADTRSFSELAKLVGETKQPYNDQR